jgi:[ribosomal protein S5]-alanine N-acetyltransferase
MEDEQNYQWLDFGCGTQKLSAPAIRLMLQRTIHEIRLFTSDESDEPIGLVALSDISEKFKTAVLWYVLGDKSRSGKSYTTRAVSQMLTIGFEERGLESIFAWVIEHNVASGKILEKNNFQFIGVRRNCHYINGRAYDRYFYDLIASEHTK